VQENTFGLSAGNPINATEGQAFSGIVATFVDPGSPDPASNFTATIDWGDGTTEAGTVTGGSGSYTGTGTHTYTDTIVGINFYSVTVTEIDANFTAGPVGNLLTVAEADVLTGTGLSITPTVESTFTGAVATFSDTGYPDNSPSDFTATIDWGDGT